MTRRRRVHARAITRNDVARAAGVSPATASLALNGHPRVAPATRRRVAEAARRLGFSLHANFAARRLAQARFGKRTTRLDQVGFIYLSGPDQRLDPGCMAMMREAEHELASLHACLVFVRAATDDDWDKVRRLAQHGIVDAWLIVGAVTDAVIARLEPLGLPFVILGDHRCTEPVHSVNGDNVAAGQAIVRRLAALGHRRVAFIGGSAMFVYQEDLVRGMRLAARELGIDDDPALYRRATFWSYPDAQSLRQWLADLGTPPTAILCDGIHKADVVMRVLRDGGMAVPGDVGIVAYDGDISTPTFSPELAGLARLEVCVGEIGRQGTLLLQRVFAEPRTPASSIRLAIPFVEGWSAGPARSANASN